MRFVDVYRRQIEWVGIVAFCLVFWSAVIGGVVAVVAR